MPVNLFTSKSELEEHPSPEEKDLLLWRLPLPFLQRYLWIDPPLHPHTQQINRTFSYQSSFLQHNQQKPTTKERQLQVERKDKTICTTTSTTATTAAITRRMVTGKGVIIIKDFSFQTNHLSSAPRNNFQPTLSMITNRNHHDPSFRKEDTDRHYINQSHPTSFSASVPKESSCRWSFIY